MEKVAHHFDSVNVAAILVKSGYRIRGRRADCPRCSGHSRLTVSFTDDGRFYCHRCGKGGNVRGLARRLGVTLPPPRLRDRKSTRLNSSHQIISYAVFCLKKKNRISTGELLNHINFVVRPPDLAIQEI